MITMAGKDLYMLYFWLSAICEILFSLLFQSTLEFQIVILVSELQLHLLEMCFIGYM